MSTTAISLQLSAFSITVFAGLCFVAIVAGDAAAHETLHEVVRGRAIAVKAFFGDGEALAYTEYEVYSPRDPKIPHQKGRTDRAGYLSFVPDADGRWRVRVIEKGGHGIDVLIDAAATAAPAGPAITSRLDHWLRPAIGLAVIAAFFGVLRWRAAKRKGTT